ncbi:hypothetical protein FQZ97_986830 [compost metagenome]
MRALDDLVSGCLQAHDALRHHLLGTLGITGHGSEGNLLVNQPVHGQHAGVAASAVDNDRIFGHFEYLVLFLDEWSGVTGGSVLSQTFGIELLCQQPQTHGQDAVLAVLDQGGLGVAQ